MISHKRASQLPCTSRVLLDLLKSLRLTISHRSASIFLQERPNFFGSIEGISIELPRFLEINSYFQETSVDSLEILKAFVFRKNTAHKVKTQSLVTNTCVYNMGSALVPLYLHFRQYENI